MTAHDQAASVDAGVPEEGSSPPTPSDGPAAESTPGDPPIGVITTSPSWSRVDWWACGALLVAALVLVALHVRAYPPASPIDEMQHIDYVLKAGDFEIPREGDRIGQAAMAEVACRGIDFSGIVLPPCGLDSYDPNDFPESGFNTAAGQWPIYYSITGVASRVVSELPGIESQVTAARLMGGLWLGAAMVLIWYLLAMFGVPRPQRAVMSALTMTTPLVVFHSSTLNADALLLLSGAIAAIATLNFEHGRLRWWWLSAVYLALVVTEPTNLLACGVGTGYLVLRVTTRNDETTVRRAVPVVLLGVLLVQRAELGDRFRSVLWPNDTSGRATGTPRQINIERAVDGVSLDRLFGQVNAVFTPVRRTYLPDHFDESVVVMLMRFSNWLLVGLLFAAAFVFVRQHSTTLLTRLTIAALMLAGPLYTWYYAYFSNVDFPTPSRFGLPLLALTVVVAATAIRTRAALVASASVAGAVALATVTLLLVA